ncbi:cyanate permease [Stella humosa]|uniref:Cyanate permease n=1 Tax=Stella humosa TaxID=94 RepID=A0A3N1KZ13_9PROT|nr:MFS transporter [Stella humosa]ROP83426.1 cyanate permease [Stella humosa]BBK33302.1 MFS transporter [Stella humosa]
MAAHGFYGWRVVGAAFVLAVFGWGVGFYGPPVYLHAVREARGWSLALVSTAVTVHFLFGAFVVANLPRLYRRFGVPKVTKAGACALAAGVAGWALAEAPWQLFLATLFSGAGWVAMGAAAVNAIVSPWFARRRPAALAMAYNGASIGGVVFSPLWVAAIAQLGFPAAALLVGVVMVLAVWLLADLFLARSPAAMGLLPDGEAAGIAAPEAPAAAAAALPAPAALWRDHRFLTLSAAMALSLFAQIGLIAHLFSVLVPALGAASAGIAMGAATAAAIAGRTLVGWAMPAGADRRLVACASYAVQIAGSGALLLAADGNVPLLLLGVLLFGAGIGNATSLPPLIAQVEFARADVPRVVALIVALAQGAYAFAPAAFGLVRELAPEGGLFLAAAMVQALAIAAFLAGRRRPV